jgi:hypothetical protein
MAETELHDGDAQPARTSEASERSRKAQATRKAKRAAIVADRERRIEQERQVLTLVDAGLEFRDIGQRLGISESWANRIYHRALARVPTEHVDAFRNRQIRRLNRLATPFYIKALGAVDENGRVVSEPDPESARVVVSIISEQDKLMGAHAPVGVEMSGPGGGPIRVVSTEAVLVTFATLRARDEHARGVLARPDEPEGVIDAEVVDDAEG